MKDKSEVEVAKAASKVAAPANAPKDSKEELGNEHHFLVGDEAEIKGLKFLVKDIRGVDLILARKDFK